MKLDNTTIDYIINVVKTAKLVGIEEVIIEPNMVRGKDPNGELLILQTKNVPAIDFGSIGISEVNTFLARYDLIKDFDHTIEATVDTGSGGVKLARSLVMKAKGIKVDYRCANPAAIKAWRQINYVPMYRVNYNLATVALIHKAANTMASPQISIISNKDGVTFEFCDVNNDTFKHVFADKVDILDGSTSTEFAHRWTAKKILPLLKQNPDGYFDIGAKGIFSFVVNNLNVYVLPKV